MPKPNSQTAVSTGNKPPKRVLAWPELEQTKAAMLNKLTSASGRRTNDQAMTGFVARYCSEPRVALTVVSNTASTLNSSSTRPRRLTCGSPQSGVWPTEAADAVCSVQGRSGRWTRPLLAT